jgi:hypothetical protein
MGRRAVIDLLRALWRVPLRALGWAVLYMALHRGRVNGA